jgi:hypothetical protein
MVATRRLWSVEVPVRSSTWVVVSIGRAGLVVRMSSMRLVGISAAPFLQVGTRGVEAAGGSRGCRWHVVTHLWC